MMSLALRVGMPVGVVLLLALAGCRSGAGGGARDVAILETSMGDIELALFRDVAPLAVENFERLSESGYFDSVTVHRVIQYFVIMSGDPTGTGSGGESIWGERFRDEFDPSVRFDRAGLLAMANRGPDTNGSQFFITLAPLRHLDDRHTIFGEVKSGMDVVEAISRVETSGLDRPVVPVYIEEIIVRRGDRAAFGIW